MGTTHDFAAKTGLSQSTIWRLVNDRTVPDEKVLTRLVQHFDEPEAAQLLISYLIDRIPPDLRPLVQIEPNVSSVREDPPLPSVFASLRPEMQTAIQRLAAMSIDDPVVEDLLISLASRLGAA